VGFTDDILRMADLRYANSQRGSSSCGLFGFGVGVEASDLKCCTSRSSFKSRMTADITGGCREESNHLHFFSSWLDEDDAKIGN
jgi:hypothetical protein